MKAHAKKGVCAACSGRGVNIHVQQAFPGFLQQVQMTCERCNGTGEYVRSNDICTECRGKCVVNEKKELEVHVESGAMKNDVINLSGEGDQVPGMRLTGNVLIFLDQRPHDTFRRAGKHLFIDHTLLLREALTGFTLPL